MKIEKTKNGYKISDLYISAALLCNNAAELSGITLSEDPKDMITSNGKPNKRVLFVIEGDLVKLKEIIDDYFNNRYMVDANMYASKIKELKTRIYANF